MTERIGAASAGAPFEPNTEPTDPIWTTGGPGTVSIEDEDSLIINPAGGGAAYAYRSFPTQVGREYTITATGANNPVYYSAGTSARASDLYPSTILLVNMAGSVSGWTLTSGPGTVTPDTGTDTVLLSSAGGTATVTRRQYTVVAGKNYRLRWTTSGVACQSSLSNTVGGEQYKGIGSANDALGDNSFIFLASSTTLYVQFQRTAAGDCTLSNIALEQID